MILLDTSVVVAAALAWHDNHELAVSSLPSRHTRAIGHVILESYSVLTRLPAPHRVSPRLAKAQLMSWLRLPPITLAGDQHERLLDALAASGLAGGTVYDGLVALTALSVGGTLLTLDRRAAPTYEAIGSDYRLIVPEPTAP